MRVCFGKKQLSSARRLPFVVSDGVLFCVENTAAFKLVSYHTMKDEADILNTTSKEGSRRISHSILTQGGSDKIPILVKVGLYCG